MKQNNNLVIFSILSGSVLILLILVQMSHRPNANKNGFIRSPAKITADLLHKVHITESHIHICSADSTRLYFSTQDPRKLFAMDYPLTKRHDLMLPIPLNQDQRIGITTSVDFPKINLYLRNASSVISYTLGDTLFYTVKLAPPIFTKVVKLSNSTLALRAFDSTRQSQLFEKVSSQTGKILARADILPKQTDAGFSTDGQLVYDSSVSKLLYIQFYQNKFYCLDTNLNFLYTGKTIDTISHTAVYTRPFSKENGKTGNLLPAVPLNVINEQDCAYKGNLYILSSLQADNEKNSLFFGSSVIDIYEIKTGHYQGSLYISNIEREKITSFTIFKNVLIAVFGTYIATYQLNP
jgi:hypothetical protein